MKIPSFRWANGAEVWNCMLEKDATYSKLRSERLLERHPSLVHSYRTILFDWLSEVSHECKFHRETYHLALDFIDRYLAATSNVCKFQLQLIGTTCLFLAAKYEEIRPPTVIEFAELTDGACRAEDIIDNEVVILSAIQWDITPMTPNSWLNVYMQMLLNPDQLDTSSCDKKSTQSTLTSSSPSSTPSPTKEVVSTSSVSAANKCLHKRIASVIDLALLHIDSLRFKNSIIAAAAIYHFTTEQCSSYTHRDLAECIRWLKPFVEVIKTIDESTFVAASSKGTHPTQMHSHIATAALLEQVCERMSVGARRHAESSATLKRKAHCLDESDGETSASEQETQVTSTTVLLTPPSSACKVRKQLKKSHHHHQHQHTYRYPGSIGHNEFSPLITPRQPLQQHPNHHQQQQQQQPLPLPPKAHAQCREKISA